MFDNPVAKKMREAQRVVRAFRTLNESQVKVDSLQLGRTIDKLHAEAEEELKRFFTEELWN